jgi:carboxylate-amine ligase
MSFLALEMLELVDDVVDDLGSREEINHIRTILERGTSADRQVQAYRNALENGASEEEALIAVVDFLTTETMRGV